MTTAAMVAYAYDQIDQARAELIAVSGQLWGPCGDAVHAGKSGVVARRGRVFLAQVSP
jgi:hypothetical protein